MRPLEERADELVAVLEDARLAGDAVAVARLGAALAERLGVAEAGADSLGPWLRLEVQGASQRMRWIPAGRYVRGSPDSEQGRYRDEGPQHPVVFARGFWLGETPVTQALWRAVVGDNPSRFVSPDRPVERVSWHDCQAFCARLSQHLPRLDLRLPTEAQWEYAARAGTTTATYAGDLDILGVCNAPVLDAIAWYGGNSGVGFELDSGYDSSDWPEKQHAHTRAGTRRVAQKRPNPWGLFDMLGNIYEWCQDHNEPYSEALHEACEQLDTPHTAGSKRAGRGGSWYGSARYARSAFRLDFDPDVREENLGFRLAGRPLSGRPSPPARDEPR